MKKNPVPSAIKGIVTREGGAKPKPHEYITAEALADSYSQQRKYRYGRLLRQ